MLKLERWERGALAGLLVLAAALRLYKLDSPLWFDEIMTLTHYVREPWGRLAADYSSFNNHLFHSLQAKAAVTLFGEHPWALRLPAMLFGVGSIWALWRVARSALRPAEALFAAALLALSYHHIWFSQNARGYTELMFWQLLALILFLEGRAASSWKTWGLFALSLAAAMYTHMTAAFFVAALGLTWLITLAARRRAPSAAELAPLGGFVAGGVLTLALCAPALLQMVHAVSIVKSGSDVDVMQEYQNPLWTLAEGVRTLGASAPLVLFAGPVIGFTAVLGIVGLFRRAPVVAGVALIHIGLTLVSLLAMNMRIWPRFFFTDLAFVMLFLALGAFEFARLAAALAARIGLGAFVTPARLATIAATLALLASAVLAVRNYTLPKQNFPAPIALLARENAPAHSVGAVGLAADAYADYLRPGWPRVQTPKDLDQLTPSPDGRRWAVVAFPGRSSRRYADVMNTLQHDWELEQRFPGTLGDGGLWVFRSRRAAVAGR